MPITQYAWQIDPKRSNNALEQLEELAPIAVVSIRGCTRVAARAHVVDPVGNLETKRARHAKKQSRLELPPLY